jgi:hypothetical protein
VKRGRAERKGVGREKRRKGGKKGQARVSEESKRK